jgi:cell division protein FtsB
MTGGQGGAAGRRPGEGPLGAAGADHPVAEERPNQGRRPGRRATPGTRVGLAVPVPPRAHRLLGLSSTRRAAVLALVVCALVLSVAVPLRNYVTQRGELDDTVRQQQLLREQVDELQRRKAQLEDPAQVEVEARNRLRYVRPGETPYIVQLPSSTPPAPPAREPRAGAADPWYDQLWKSITASEHG